MKIKKAGWWIVIVVGVAGMLLFLFGKQGIYFQYRQLNRKRAEIEMKSITIDSLQREILRLTNDTATIERIAREKLGMARPGERVYKFIERRK